MVGNARSGIGIWCLSRCGVGGKAPALQEKVKMEVERWKKTVRKVFRGGESESDVVAGVMLEVRLRRFKKMLKWT